LKCAISKETPSTKINKIGICYSRHTQSKQAIINCSKSCSKLLNILISKSFHHWTTPRLWELHHNFHLQNIYFHLDCCWVFCWNWLAFSGVPFFFSLSLSLKVLKRLSWYDESEKGARRPCDRGLVQFVPKKKHTHTKQSKLSLFPFLTSSYGWRPLWLKEKNPNKNIWLYKM
jgi:hypothetical protein